MAKGNMFLGMSSGKVADVVFYRMNGEQMTRARNRHPQNPRTNPQLYQRAIMATITQAYAAGKAIFDHSFEGRKVGAECQQAFSSKNIKYLRSLIAADIERGFVTDPGDGRVVGPGIAYPVGFAGMQVSEGTYQQAFFIEDKLGSGTATGPGFLLPNTDGAQTCKEYAELHGLVAGDYYTIVGFAELGDAQLLFTTQAAGSSSAGKQYVQRFFFLRFGVKASFVSSTDSIEGKDWGDIFFIDSNSPTIKSIDLSQYALADELVATDIIIDTEGLPKGVWGMIRSRKDMDLRSSCTLDYFNDSTTWGITSQWALDAWSQGTQNVGDSNLILEGGGF